MVGGKKVRKIKDKERDLQGGMKAVCTLTAVSGVDTPKYGKGIQSTINCSM